MTAFLITVVLLLANAFFVGAEFAAMSARRSQLEPLAEQGSKRAAACLVALEQMGSLLACAQLGITLCSVLLGAISEAALHHVLVPPLEHLGVPQVWAESLALVLALLVVVYCHVVIGEMIPKNLALAGPDRAALILVPWLMRITRVLRPAIAVMEWLAKRIVSLLGVEPKDEITDEFTAEEVAHIVEESQREGLVEDDRVGLISSALEFSDKSARDVGVPLSQLVTVGPQATPDDIERLIARRGFSRYPVVSDAGDLMGYLHLKDILYADEQERAEPVPRKRVRRLATVGVDDEVEDVLQVMQSTGAHLAQVVGGDGVPLGVVFLEDVLEELVGEVTDATTRTIRASRAPRS